MREISCWIVSVSSIEHDICGPWPIPAISAISPLRDHVPAWLSVRVTCLYHHRLHGRRRRNLLEFMATKRLHKTPLVCQASNAILACAHAREHPFRQDVLYPPAAESPLLPRNHIHHDPPQPHLHRFLPLTTNGPSRQDRHQRPHHVGSPIHNPYHS